MKNNPLHTVWLLSLLLLSMATNAQNVASVTVGTDAPVMYADFDAAWNYAMTQTNATVTLLDNVTRSSAIVYKPTGANARHTLDLNNFTISGVGDVDRLLTVYKEDARLTVTDLSVAQGGCLSHIQSRDTNLYTVVIDKGVFELVGGKVYCENTLDNEDWHPAVGIHNQRSSEAKIIISGGLVEALSPATAYAVSAYGPVEISGGALKATVTKYTNARALTQNAATATITGGTFEVRATGTASYAYTVVAAFSTAVTSDVVYNGTVNITGGTFLTSGEAGSLGVLRAEASVTQTGSGILKGHGTINVSGGSFTARCKTPEAKQVFCGVVNADRLFDDATPHHMIDESLGEMNISGGTFLIDMRDGDAYYGDGDVDALRSWGKLNVTGGDFSVYTRSSGTGISVFRNKAIVSDNPTFTIHSVHGARALVAGPWNSSKYCDADASKNWAEIDVSGGTYLVNTLSDSISAMGAWAQGGVSTASATVDPGYAMSARITITGGEFTTINPNSSYSRPIRQEVTKTGLYGKALSQLIVRGGKFKALTGTLSDNTPTGKNIESSDELYSLSRGYFASFNQLAMHTDDTCTILTLDTSDPEYANGYRYKIANGPAVATVTVGSDTKPFSMLQSAIRYAGKQTDAIVTMIADDTFWGPHFLTPKAANNHTTIDLNGFTVTGLTSSDRFVVPNKADMTLTITDNSVSKTGNLNFSTYYNGTLYAVMPMMGTVEMNGGTLSITNTKPSYPASAFFVRGGTLLLSNETTVSAPRLLQMTSGSTTISGGRFNCPVNVSGAVTGALNIRGGYYATDKQIASYCKHPYYVKSTTAAEQATYGPEYLWKVEPLPQFGPYMDIIDVDNTHKTLTLNVSNWEVNSWPYTINGVAYAKSARAADRTLKIPYDGVPGDDFYIFIKKSNDDILSNRLYVIPAEIASPTTLTSDETKPLFVKGTTLIVDANISTRNLYIAPDAKLTVNSGRTLSADTILLRTMPSNAAQLINHGAIAGSTKVVYTRIISDKSGYTQFGLPLTCLTPINAVRLSNGENPNYKAGSGWALRYYDEASRATNGKSEEGANWHTLEGTASIIGGKGYEMYSGVNYYREFYFPVDVSSLTNEVAVSHTNGQPADAGWNLLVSPLTYTYSNVVAPEGLAVSWLLPDGTFEQEIPSSIPPAKAFAYQAAANGTLSFAGSSIAAGMPRRVAATEEQEQIQWIHLDITDANGIGDQTSIYSHPSRYEDSYKTGIDVAKQSLTASRAIIYSSHAYGDMAFAGVADSLLERGVVLTVYSPIEQELVISMRENEWLDRMEHVWLIDHKSGVRTDLLHNTYPFTATAGTTFGRFTIEGVFRAPQQPSSLEPAESDSNTPRKVLIGTNIYIIINGRWYDSTGRIVRIN